MPTLGPASHSLSEINRGSEGLRINTGGSQHRHGRASSGGVSGSHPALCSGATSRPQTDANIKPPQEQPVFSKQTLLLQLSREHLPSTLPIDKTPFSNG